MKKYLASLFFLISFTVSAKNCEIYDVKIIFDRKDILTKEILCTQKNADNLIFYTSKSCDQNKCEILKRKKTTLRIPDYTANLGSPGFKLCTELGGVPQIFEFKKKKEIWQSTERCFFEKDFVEISYLTYQWKSFINN